MVDAKYLHALVRSGGRGRWSNTIYRLAKYARQHGGPKYVLMDWGPGTQMRLLSRGRLNQEEYFWGLMEENRDDELADRLYQKARQEPENVYVFFAPPWRHMAGPRRIYELMLEKYGLTAETVRVFHERDGNPVYVLERVR